MIGRLPCAGARRNPGRVGTGVLVTVDTRDSRRPISAELNPIYRSPERATAQHRLLLSCVARKSQFY
jgi:hypothetical protein